MRVRAFAEFSLLDFETWEQPSMERGTCRPGEYELVSGEHPNSKLQFYNGDPDRPNPILHVETSPQGTRYGACRGWWEREVEEGRMEWVTPPPPPLPSASQPRSRTDTLQMGLVQGPVHGPGHRPAK